MKRRKLMIGMGSVAVGGMAAFGGNAFNMARVDRGISVQTVGDGSSYLTLIPRSAYAEYDGADRLRIAFDGSIGAQNASGIPDDANFTFTDVFEIQNQGKDSIAVTLSESYDSVNWETNFPRAFYSYEPLGTTNDKAGDGEFTGSVSGDGAVLGPGENLLVHFEFVGRDEDDRWTDTNEPETVSVYAEAVDTDE